MRTGCAASDRAGADRALASYLGQKYTPPTGKRGADLSITDVLVTYNREHAPHTSAPKTIGYATSALMPFWMGRSVLDVKAKTCRDYAARRARDGVKPSTVRRELGVMQAALTYWHREHGPLDSIPVVTMPDRAAPRERWLTRSEAARLLAGALGWYVAAQDIKTRRTTAWRRNRSTKAPYLARFILIGLYTGTRHGAILGLQWHPNTTGGWVDLDAGVLHRRAEGSRLTNKRRPPVRVGRRLLAHMRRWARLDRSTALHVVSYNGRPILKERRAWGTAVANAHLGHEVVPHVLRHTRATWMMQAGVPLWEAAGALGMSPAILERVYGHHSPDWQKRAAEA